MNVDRHAFIQQLRDLKAAVDKTPPFSPFADVPSLAAILELKDAALHVFASVEALLSADNPDGVAVVCCGKPLKDENVNDNSADGVESVRTFYACPTCLREFTVTTERPEAVVG